ncbi:flavodoxin family protein [Pseudorhodoplanes sp.]|uniref:flavodoxin family protein n=1 Tax=Pseudorhodoplanes sp. TaxID=1934341 RepID=UPI003D11AE16
MALTAFALNCSLKGIGDGEKSSTDVLLRQLIDALAGHDVASGGVMRAVDHDIKPGVKDDEGKGDAWPDLLKRVLAADIFVLGTPIWLGQPSSVCKRVLERLDAVIHDMDDRKRMKTYNRVALVAVVGNEDGAHHVSAELYQALSDCGFTIPANGMTYWVGEAMQSKNYDEFSSAPDKVAVATAMAAANAAHLARLLSEKNYPGVS